MAAKTMGIKKNELFYFQTVEIQQFVKHEMNCDYLPLSVIDCNFANEINPCWNDQTGCRYEAVHCHRSTTLE